MAVYLGGSYKLKVILDNVSYRLSLPSREPEVRLLSSDNFILKSSDGLWLIPLPESKVLTSLDGYVLTDLNSNILTVKGG